MDFGNLPDTTPRPGERRRVVKTYQTREEIWADDSLTVNQKADAIIALNNRLAAMPPSVPTPTADERRQFSDLAKTLETARDSWLALDEKEKKFSVWFPAAAEQLRKLEAETPPDATAEAVDELNRLARRVQLARTFDGSVGSVRQVINNRVAGAFFALNKLLSKFSTGRFPRQFLLAGTSPTVAITDALATVDALLSR